MKYSLSKKIVLLLLPALLLNFLVGAVGWVQFKRLSSNLATAELHNSALRDQLECDMMHDALRADVLAGFQAISQTNAAALKEVQQDLEGHVKEFQSHLQENQKRSLNGDAAKEIANVHQPLTQYIQAANEVVGLLSTDPANAQAKLPAFFDTFKVLEGRMQKVSDSIESETHKANDAIEASVSHFSLFLTSSVAIAIVLLIVLPIVVARTMPKPFRIVAQELSSVASYTREAVDQMRSGSQTLAEGASSQASSLEETSAALEEIASMVKRNAESAKGAEGMAKETKSAADDGAREVALMTKVTKQISVSSNDLKSTMNEIRLASDGVAKIVKTIDEIAFQTNILALNAAVEAARAGEAGLGFAVVADEVRNLAQRSANSAKETAEKIKTAIDRSQAGIQVSERLIKSLQDMEGQAERVEKSLSSILEKSRQTDSFVQGICQACQEQSQGIQQVTTSVTTIDRITQANSATAEQSAANAASLQEQGRILVATAASLVELVEGSSNASQKSAASDPNDSAPHGTEQSPPHSAPQSTWHRGSGTITAASQHAEANSGGKGI